MTDAVFNVISTVVLFLAVVGLYAWAERAQHDRSAYVGLYLLFGIPGGLVVLTGAAFLFSDLRYGVSLLAIGLGLSLPLLAPFRQLVARIGPLDPGSAVDMAGLCVFLGVLGFLTLPTDPEDIGSASTVALVTQLALEVAVAYAAVGFWRRRDLRAASARLGLRPISLRVVGIALGYVVLAWIVAVAAGILTQQLQPDLSEEIDQVSEEMTEDVRNPVGAAVLGISAGVGEELLFRGAFQPRFGLGLTSFAFGLVHQGQYGFSFVTLGLIGIGLLLGILRQRYGTVAPIITHAVYNFLSVLAQSLPEESLALVRFLP